MPENEERQNRRIGEGALWVWRPTSTSSKLLALSILAGIVATATAEAVDLFEPFSILNPETITYVLFGVAAICLLAWITLASTGLVKKKSIFKQASTVVLSSSVVIFIVMMGSLILLSDVFKEILLHFVIMACVIILPPSLFFVFLAMRKQSLLNSFITNLSRLGMLDRRRDGPFQRAESEDCRLCRIRSYFERFSAHYGLVNTPAMVKFVVAMKDRPEDGAGTDRDAAGDPEPTFLDSSAKAPVYAVRTVLPVVLSVVPVTIGWLLVLPPKPLGPVDLAAPAFTWFSGPVVPELSAVGFAFLGAYFFSLQMLVRRFITRDLAPNAYTQISQRIILAIIAAWLLEYVVRLRDWQLYAAAFVFGAFPVVVWQVLAQTVKKLLGSLLRIPSLQTGRPVGELSGLTVWHELRLEEEDVENVEAMASADIVEIMLSTKLPAHRIIDWIDEALLRLSLPPILDEKGKRKPHPLEASLAECGIRTATGLVCAYYGSARAGEAGPRAMLDPDVTKDLHPVIAEIMLQPNFRHVAEWKRLPPAIFEDLESRITQGLKGKDARLDKDVIPHPSARPGAGLIAKGAGPHPGRSRRPAV
jgi:hypothetical protein